MRTVADVVRTDLCIGCGLCESVTGGRVAMVANDAGSLRPSPVDGFTEAEEAIVLGSCPGTVATVRDDGAPSHDLVWGSYRRLAMAWAGDAAVRHRGSSGGVLTALARAALASGRVAFVLHVGPDPARPARNRWVISETPDDVLANAGSRYAPTSPLAGLAGALDRDEPFAIVAKPCDLGALHRYALADPRLDDRCLLRLSMVCGGQSRFTKTATLLETFGVAERDVAEVRYRGFGNPGPTVVRTRSGDEHRTTYLDLWADERAWDLETRCKLCPDALGECADVVALDAWPGGSPVGEDEGFNAIVVRSAAGASLVEHAASSGSIVLGDPLDPGDLNALQPHQVRKKLALSARYDGMAAAGVAPIATSGLRIAALGERFTGDPEAERDGTRRRMAAIRRAGGDASRDADRGGPP